MREKNPIKTHRNSMLLFTLFYDLEGLRGSWCDFGSSFLAPLVLERLPMEWLELHFGFKGNPKWILNFMIFFIIILISPSSNKWLFSEFLLGFYSVFVFYIIFYYEQLENIKFNKHYKIPLRIVDIINWEVHRAEVLPPKIEVLPPRAEVLPPGAV